MKSQLVAILLVAICSNFCSTQTLTSTTAQVHVDELFNLTCNVDIALPSEGIIVEIAQSRQRVVPNFANLISRFSIDATGKLIHTNGNPQYLLHKGIITQTFPTFEIQLEPYSEGANGIYRCILKNYTDNTILGNPGLWESEFQFTNDDKATVSNVEVSLEVEKIADSANYLAKCVTKVVPTNVDYSVGFVADYDDRDKQVMFGSYLVSFDAKAISWLQQGTSDSMNIYPQNVAYPNFEVLVQSSHSLDTIKNKLQCLVQMKYVATQAGQPQMQTVHFSNSAAFSVTGPTVLVMALMMLAKTVGFY